MSDFIRLPDGKVINKKFIRETQIEESNESYEYEYHSIVSNKQEKSLMPAKKAKVFVCYGSNWDSGGHTIECISNEKAKKIAAAIDEMLLE